jgi:hypothetical protein
MHILLQSFAAGLAFALGAFVGIGVAGLLFRSRDNGAMDRLLDTNKRIEDRLNAQVSCLTRIAAAAERSKEAKP